MTIIVPGAMFAAGISLYLFYRYDRINREKLDDRRESLNETRRQYLQHLIEAGKKEKPQGQTGTPPGAQPPSDPPDGVA